MDWLSCGFTVLGSTITWTIIYHRDDQDHFENQDEDHYEDQDHCEDQYKKSRSKELAKESYLKNQTNYQMSNVKRGSITTCGISRSGIFPISIQIIASFTQSHVS